MPNIKICLNEVKWVDVNKESKLLFVKMQKKVRMVGGSRIEGIVKWWEGSVRGIRV